VCRVHTQLATLDDGARRGPELAVVEVLDARHARIRIVDQQAGAGSVEETGVLSVPQPPAGASGARVHRRMGMANGRGM